MPATHTSLAVQALASVQLALLGKNKQLAEPVSHTSSVQGLPSSQTVADPPLHFPAVHTSPCVQPLPSLHATLLSMWLQPFSLSHASSVQALLSLQFCPPMLPQIPPLQTSLSVQPLPSSQGLPSSGALWHPVAGSQL